MPPHHHGADGGLRRHHAAAVARRGGPRARRPGRLVARSCTSTPRSTSTCRWASSPSGPNSLELGGRCFDEVVLHTYFTDETTERARADGEAGRRAGGARSGDVRVWSCFATIGDHLPERPAAQEDRRAAGHLPPGLRRPARADQRLGPGRARPLPRRRRSSARFPGAIDGVATTEQLEHVATLIPDEWLAPSATGHGRAVRGRRAPPARPRLRRRDPARRDPAELAPVVTAYRDA